jgi:6-phosphogluconolactonase (cycloisomerase 2 family)
VSLGLPTLLVGSYTATGGGNGTGISAVTSGADGELSAETVAVMDDPSFLAVDGDRVYAVSETADGMVVAFRREGTALAPLWQAPAGGDAPCHVRVDPSGALVVTNYTSGTVTAVGLPAVADLEAGVVPDSALDTAVLPDVTGPMEDRQEGPHAHQSTVTPEGTVLVADLGGDALHEFRVTDAPVLEPVRVHHVALGTGPRHMGWWDGDLVVAGELDGSVHRLRRDDSGAYGTVAVAATTAPGEDGVSQLSHLEVDERGRVYVAVRGRDVVAVLDASDGGLTLVGTAPCGGTWPRHFAFAAGHLLVANQMSDAIAVLPLGSDGVPGAPVAQIAVGSPACIVAV